MPYAIDWCTRMHESCSASPVCALKQQHFNQQKVAGTRGRHGQTYRSVLVILSSPLVWDSQQTSETVSDELYCVRHCETSSTKACAVLSADPTFTEHSMKVTPPQSTNPRDSSHSGISEGPNRIRNRSKLPVEH